MSRSAVACVIPLLTGFLYAQEPNVRTETTTTKTTWSGTLVDEACHTSHSQTKQSATDARGATRTETTTTVVTECPVTTTTTSFGFITPEGKYMRFDAPSNTKIVQIVKDNKEWEKQMSDRAPLKVRIVGTANGDIVLLESIQ